MTKKIKIGFQLIPQHGHYKRMCGQWMEAEALGVDALYAADHFFSQAVTAASGEGSEYPAADSGLNFEGASITAAMAATTTRSEIGCLVHATGFRNPNLLADMARTMDHISGGRYILGLGSGYMQPDYEEYGFEFGTAKSRLLALARDLPIIKARFDKLNPLPLRKIPILIGSAGAQIGLRIVAEHADIWHVFGTLDTIAEKTELLKSVCKEIGRDFNEIELSTFYFPQVIQQEIDPGEFVKLGIRNIIHLQHGPEWDLALLRELLAWRKGFSS